MKPIIIPLLALAFTPSISAHAQDQIHNISAPQLPWQKTQEGAEFAALQGDRFQGAYQAMVRLPAGIESPLHIKTATMYGVVVEGTFVHSPANTPSTSEIPLGPGSFYKIPAGLAHISKCISATPCVSYLFQDGAFDFIPVKK